MNCLAAIMANRAVGKGEHVSERTSTCVSSPAEPTTRGAVVMGVAVLF